MHPQDPITPEETRIVLDVMSRLSGLREDTAVAVKLKLISVIRNFPSMASDTDRLARLALVMARNFEIDQARHQGADRRAKQRLIHEPAKELRPLPEAALQAAIDMAISRLNADERLLVQFRIVNGLTLAQIAEITGTYPSAITRSLDRALDTIRQVLLSHAKDDAELQDALRARGIIP